MGWEVIFWNHTAFDLEELGYKEIKLKGKPRSKTDLLKRAKIITELDRFTTKFSDSVYQTYKFTASRNSFKARLKNSAVSTLVRNHTGEIGLHRLRNKLKKSERKGEYYKNCKELLEEEKPDLIFCTNQRPVNAIAPLTAAQDLGIPTATFIFSWDNLPKATMVVDTDHYFVWSDHMKQELLKYYPHIKRDQIFITGSPQFEPHYYLSIRQSRKDFFKEHGLELSRKYICFSGDDVTTSPDDPQYLDDVAEAVRNLNLNGHTLGIIFRRCPVDFSERYNFVLEKYQDLIVPIDPFWKKYGENWNTILPTKEDLKLQVNTILHTEAVVNVGSSMIFDFAVYGKPCLYINYEVPKNNRQDWSIKKIYNFVHFKSMPTGEEVYWLNSKEEIGEKLDHALQNPNEKVPKAIQWFNKINIQPANEASRRIWENLSIL